MKSAQSVDMTEGPVFRQMMRFMMPVLWSSIFQQLYSTVDFMFVGNYLATSAAAAVGAGSSMISLLIGLFAGISTGTGIITAKAFGERDIRKLSDILHTTFALSLYLGLFMMIAGILLVPSFLTAVNIPDEAESEALMYLRIYLLSLPSMVVYNMASSYMRGEGDSVSPFRVLASCGFVNTFLDFLLIVIIPMGVTGAALATALSQTLSAVMVIVLLKRKRGENLRKLFLSRMDLKILISILQVGLPAGIQSIVITVANIVVQFYINGLGLIPVAGFSVYYKLENFIYLPILAFGQTAATFSAQNYGSRNFRRIHRGIWICLMTGILVTFCIACGILIYPHPIYRLFMKDAQVIASALRISRVTFYFYWLYLCIEVLSGAVRGMGRSLSCLCIVLTTLCGMRILLLYFFARTEYTLENIAATYPLTWVAAALMFLILFYRSLSSANRHQRPDDST